jgi:uncharacterized protein (DUF169 family)
MTELITWQNMGSDLISLLGLETSPLGLKFITSESEIPEDTLRPHRNKGQHLAQCQAFALSRRQGLTIAMTMEDHWCWGPLLGYGLVPHQPALNIPATRRQAEILPRIDLNKYIGLLCGPLDKTFFVPDLALIYCNTAQLRQMLMAFKFSQKGLISSEFDPIDSCVYSVVPAFLNRQIRITLPDPGESERAGAEDYEIILSVPAEKIEQLCQGIVRAQSFAPPQKYVKNVRMQSDFQRPEFYGQLFKIWGLQD